MRRLVLAFAVLFQISSGTDLCSISETDVACHPCSAMCPGREEMCFRCPDGCGGDCSSTCGDRCLHGVCHYTDTAQLQCSQGCKEGWAGIFCQEGCPPNCVLCDQFNSTCRSCVEGYQGDRCTNITTAEAEHSTDTGTTTRLSDQETTQGETESTDSTITATSSVNCVKEDPATGATSNRSKDRNLRLNCTEQGDPRTDLCSLHETDVACLPCSVMCPGREEMCFRCPDGCGEGCSSTCGDTCLHGACHYTDTAHLQCTQGCKEGWAGIFCQEGCPPNCVLCDQFNSTCRSCVEGYQGDRCTHITTAEAEHSPDTGTTTSEHETTQGETESTDSTITATSSVNCLNGECDSTTGATSYGCKDGYEGLNCGEEVAEENNLGESNLTGWQGILIGFGVGLAFAVLALLIRCEAGKKLMAVYGFLRRVSGHRDGEAGSDSSMTTEHDHDYTYIDLHDNADGADGDATRNVPAVHTEYRSGARYNSLSVSETYIQHMYSAIREAPQHVLHSSDQAEMFCYLTPQAASTNNPVKAHTI